MSTTDSARLEPLDLDAAAATHALINITEDLARYLRVISKGALTLAVVSSRATTLRDRAGMGWFDAHEFADVAVGRARRGDVQDAQAAILRGEGALGRHLTKFGQRETGSTPE
jgi:hypothetical protein